MLAGGAAAVNCEQDSAPRSWRRLGKSAPLETSTSVRLSVHFFRTGQPTSSVAVWACVVPPSVMQHAVLLVCDSWMRLNTRFYRSFPPRPSDQRFCGELTLSHHAPTGASVSVPDPLACGGGFHLLYDGADRVNLSAEPQLLPVNLARSNGRPALTGHYLVEMLPPQPDVLLAEERFAASGRQILPISGATDLEPGDLLGVAHATLMRAPIAVFLGTNNASAFSPPRNAPEVAVISEPSLAAATATASPLSALLECLTPEQRVSFLRVWHRRPRHLRDISFDLHSPE